MFQSDVTHSLFSLVSFLEDLVAQLEPELEREHAVQHTAYAENTGLLQFGHTIAAITSPVPEAGSSEVKTAAYSLATAAASSCVPVVASNYDPQYALPYYRVFFLSAELPFPLGFQKQRQVNMPRSHDGASLTQLPEEVADKLMAVYVDRILPQYPLFLKHEMCDMFQRFKAPGRLLVTPDEQFTVSMILAIAVLSSRAKEYQKLVSVAESLRRDAFSCLDFGRSVNKATMNTIQHLVLLAQYGSLLPSSTNLWQVCGDAMRIALELGLHQEVPAESGMDEADTLSRKRIFWTVSCSDSKVVSNTDPVKAPCGRENGGHYIASTVCNRWRSGLGLILAPAKRFKPR